MRLPGKVAIITGGAHGMGAEEAKLFVQEGANLVIADVLEDEGKKLAAEINQPKGEAMFVRTDVTSEADWKRLVEATVARFGKLDILVNNAGLSSTSEADPMDTEGWRRIMEVNTTGVFLGTKYAIPAMQQAGGGAIVNISSIMGFVGAGGIGFYLLGYIQMLQYSKLVTALLVTLAVVVVIDQLSSLIRRLLVLPAEVGAVG